MAAYEVAKQKYHKVKAAGFIGDISEIEKAFASAVENLQKLEVEQHLLEEEIKKRFKKADEAIGQSA